MWQGLPNVKILDKFFSHFCWSKLNVFSFDYEANDMYTSENNYERMVNKSLREKLVHLRGASLYFLIYYTPLYSTVKLSQNVFSTQFCSSLQTLVVKSDMFYMRYVYRPKKVFIQKYANTLTIPYVATMCNNTIIENSKIFSQVGMLRDFTQLKCIIKPFKV